MDRFKQTYFEESAELLGVAEAGLLRLTPGSVDMDEVNAIFRAVHSIKGGGGAFGFDRLVAFAHEFETVMDGVRSEALPVTSDLVDVLIRANDVLGQLVAYARDETAPPVELGAEVVRLLKQWVAQMNGVVDDNGAASEAPAASPSAGAGGAGGAGGSDVGRTYVIHFHPKLEMLLSGNEPAFMLRALARLGTVVVACDISRLPTLTQLEAELCYLGWTVTLSTDAGRDQIDDVFEFVADDSLIEIHEQAARTPEAAAPESAPAAPTAGQSAPGGRETWGSPSPAAAPGRQGGEAPPRATAASPPALFDPDTRAAATAPAGPTSPAGGASSGGATSGGASSGGALSGGAPSLTSHTIRVDLEKIERLVNMVGEMVITQAMVAEHSRDLPPGEFQELLEGLEQLAQHTRELRESVMSIRAQPVGSVFSRMPRLVRELAGELGKQVRLVMSGEATEVDKTVVENLVDPLTHMIRNSIDHGIEMPEDRVQVGKAPIGTVHLSALHRSGRIVIEVTDDGRGIDRRRVLDKAIERGLVARGAHLGDEEIDNLIFLPGFSTADHVTNISGRGVGMDVVRRNITALGGRIVISSTPGEGSRFVLSLPLTLAVLDGMVISVGAERFVLPLTNIVESLRPKPADLHGVINRWDVIMARGEYVRLVYLHRLFGIPGAVTDPTKGLVVLLETEEGGQIGLVVDEVIGQQQVVIKSLESNFRRLDGLAAATILGDGRVALILDVSGLQEMSRQAAAAGQRLLTAGSGGQGVAANG